MHGNRTPLWRLSELAARSRDLLRRFGDREGESRRVRWVPNARLIRYYTTLGLLDRAAEMRGRTAFYGPRHLLQLLAVKRLQLQGRTLEEIQRELQGLGDEQLRVRAGLPVDWDRLVPETAPETASEPAPGSVPSPPEAEEAFWLRRPSVSPMAHPADSIPSGSERRGAPGRRLRGIPLGPGAELILSEELLRRVDPERLREVTRGLIEVLHGGEEEREHD